MGQNYSGQITVEVSALESIKLMAEQQAKEAADLRAILEMFLKADAARTEWRLMHAEAVQKAKAFFRENSHD